MVGPVATANIPVDLRTALCGWQEDGKLEEGCADSALLSPCGLQTHALQILAQPKGDEFDGTKDFANKILAYYMMSLKGVSKKVRGDLNLFVPDTNPRLTSVGVLTRAYLFRRQK